MTDSFYKSLCKWAAEAGCTNEQALQMGVLAWASQYGEVPGFDPRQEKGLMEAVADMSPFEGRWVSSKKTKGKIRPSNDPTCFTFSEFWDMYGFKKGSRADTERIWQKYGETERAAVKGALPAYLNSTTTYGGKQETFIPMRAYPATYLNGKYWQGNERSFAIPDGAEHAVRYKAYVEKWHGKIGILALTYSEYEEIVIGLSRNTPIWKLKEMLEEAHLLSLRDEVTTVYDALKSRKADTRVV
jgi:hypothetical protein